MSTNPLEQSVTALVAALQVLSADVVAAASLPEKLGDTQFARRAYVRAVFAMIEGNINLMADVVLSAASRGEVTLSTNDYEVLRQERSTVTVGEVSKTQVKFVPIRDRVGIVMREFAATHNGSFKLDKSTAGWTNFTAAIDLRNRITHPKDASSFEVSDAVLANVGAAKHWFADQVEEILKLC